jgi:hypothetical protein
MSTKRLTPPRLGLRLLCLALLFGSLACGSSSVESMDALSQMEIAFEGSYTKEQIKEKLDKAMALYDLPINEENYSRSGSALVGLRKETGIKEMAILNYMIRSKVPGVKISFPEAAGISVSFLKAGDK